ncbi:hypothetical protein PsorP6_016178 [Peronosclerospora sorghi]|uniref:Uncharacterized protein n=1 Tax=Peronosclerospora sorghi TaxID=230839 RepID=A0ACC0VLS3_9STRA|nr:hypothetical protein PsorP6_016178 [Peronosclerospora sorghi]
MEKDVLSGAVTDVIKNRENVLTHLFFQTDKLWKELEDKVDEVTYAYLKKINCRFANTGTVILLIIPTPESDCHLHIRR